MLILVTCHYHHNTTEHILPVWTIHSYCSRQDKRLDKAVFNSGRGTHHIKWLHLQSQYMNTNVGHSFTPDSSVRMCEGSICHTLLAFFCLSTHVVAPRHALHGIQLLQHRTGSPLNHYLRVLDADLTTTNSCPQTSCLQSLTLWGLELI